MVGTCFSGECSPFKATGHSSFGFIWPLDMTREAYLSCLIEGLAPLEAVTQSDALVSVKDTVEVTINQDSKSFENATPLDFELSLEVEEANCPCSGDLAKSTFLRYMQPAYVNPCNTLAETKTVNRDMSAYFN